MRPPICEICLQDCGVDGLVSFRRTPSDEEWDRMSQMEGFVGHPPYVGWFCPAHLEAARALRDLTIDEALTMIRRVPAAGGQTSEHLCAELRFALPSQFKLTDHVERSEQSVLNIPGETTIGQFWLWEDSRGARVRLECWSNRPPHPGEPLEIARSWVVEHSGLIMRLAREATGRESLAHAWFELPSRGHFHLTAVGVEDEDFTRVVTSIDFPPD